MKKIFLIAISVFAFASCIKDTGDRAGDSGVVYLEIVPGVAGSVSAEMATRAKIDGDFVSGSQIGLGISGTGVHSMYNNFYATYDGAGWGYYPNNSYVGGVLAGFASWNIIRVKGYYPYDNSVTDLNAVPFNIANLADISGNSATTVEERATVDYMVAQTQGKDMNISGSAYVELAFEHMMTSISFYARRSYQGPQIRLTKVKFEIDGSRYFGVRGTYDADEPLAVPAANLTVTDNVQTLEVTYPTSTDKTYTYNTSYRETSLLMIPQLEQTGVPGGADDAVVKVTFYFTDAYGTAHKFDNYTDGNPTMSFRLSDIANDNTSSKGFLAGYNYRIQAELGTYVRFEGAPQVVERTQDDNTDPVHIDV